MKNTNQSPSVIQILARKMRQLATAPIVGLRLQRQQEEIAIYRRIKENTKRLRQHWDAAVHKDAEEQNSGLGFVLAALTVSDTPRLRV